MQASAWKHTVPAAHAYTTNLLFKWYICHQSDISWFDQFNNTGEELWNALISKASQTVGRDPQGVAEFWTSDAAKRKYVLEFPHIPNNINRFNHGGLINVYNILEGRSATEF
jgi:hypothetical protein